MAAPHIAGALALLRQKFPNANGEEIKSLMMGTAKQIRDAGKSRLSSGHAGCW